MELYQRALRPDYGDSTYCCFRHTHQQNSHRYVGPRRVEQDDEYFEPDWNALLPAYPDQATDGGEVGEATFGTVRVFGVIGRGIPFVAVGLAVFDLVSIGLCAYEAKNGNRPQ